MDQTNFGDLNQHQLNKEKILLVLLPFWDPMIPPAGISCLKSFLQGQGYGCPVKTADANVIQPLKEIYHNYFDALKKNVPENKYGNFYKIGHDVLRNHLLAHFHIHLHMNRGHANEKSSPGDEQEYIELVREVIYKTFYVDVADDLILELIAIACDFYLRLEGYFLRLLEQEKPSVLGISVYSDTLAASLFAFQLAKEKYPHIRTIMGGGVFATDLAVGTPNFQLLLEKYPYIDHILVGEGEILLRKLLQGELNPSQRVFTLDDINREILDIKMVDMPDFSDFDLLHYPYLMAYTSRSCPFQCRFCTETIHWGRYRRKKGKQAARELVKLFQKYGSQLFLMADSLLNPGLADLSNELIKVDVPIYWDGYIRVDSFISNKENALLLRRAGFYRARLGIESGSRRVLDLMDKKITVDQVKTAISSLSYAGIKTTTYWVIGYPGETEEDFRETLELIEEIGDDIYEADCSPFWYFPTVRGDAHKWANQAVPLYSEKTNQQLMMQTWIVNCEPDRKEIYQRMQRFVRHCKTLGVPNPYSLEDIVEADKRWQELHKNAVPALIEFNTRDTYIDEKKTIRQLVTADVPQEEGDFDF
jgi:hypothetical protein